MSLFLQFLALWNHFYQKFVNKLKLSSKKPTENAKVEILRSNLEKFFLGIRRIFAIFVEISYIWEKHVTRFQYSDKFQYIFLFYGHTKEGGNATEFDAVF